MILNWTVVVFFTGFVQVAFVLPPMNIVCVPIFVTVTGIGSETLPIERMGTLTLDSVVVPALNSRSGVVLLAEVTVTVKDLYTPTS